MGNALVNNKQEDSPLSITANVVGMLTFVAAIFAGAFVRFRYMRNSDREYIQVKMALAWYKTESEWLAQLIKAAGDQPDAQYQPEYQIYSFVMDGLLRLEKRILELVDAVEERVGSEDEHSEGKRWAMISRKLRFTTPVAVAWLPIRAQTLELVRQREALTARVSFAQISMIASRIRDLERRSELREDKIAGYFQTVAATMEDRKAETYRLEDLLYRTMHRDHVHRYGTDSPVSPWAKNLSGKSGQNGSLRSLSPRRRAMSE
ncbi:hypothetical protein F4782DRAFT_527383 [Xylaria castorea]|nr:hypothetical protein F4782DRAFT_527383 [Xylaria castorea]